MSLLNNALVPVVVVGLCGLGLVLGVQRASQERTAAHKRQADQRRAEEAAAEASERAVRIRELATRVAAAERRNAALATAAALFALPGDPTQGQEIYASCATCHGRRGEGKQVFYGPRLAGQEPWYVRSQLVKFKEGVRGIHPYDIYGMEMAMAVKVLDDEEAMDDVVAYIAGLELKKAVNKSGGDAAAGKPHYATCAPCHGPAAQGIERHKAPALSNQHAWYLEKQLMDFKTGLRGGHAKDIEGQQMIAAMQLVDDGAFADLVAYIQSRGGE